MSNKDFNEYNKEMDKLIESFKFKKLDIDGQLMAMLELSNKFDVYGRVNKSRTSVQE